MMITKEEAAKLRGIVKTAKKHALCDIDTIGVGYKRGFYDALQLADFLFCLPFTEREAFFGKELYSVLISTIALQDAIEGLEHYLDIYDKEITCGTRVAYCFEGTKISGVVTAIGTDDICVVHTDEDTYFCVNKGALVAEEDGQND